jgi:hypothetical protein
MTNKLSVGLLVAALPWLAGNAAAQEKGKPDKRDLQAREAAERFMEAVWRRDLEAAMKGVDVPFFWDGVENVQGREELKKRLERVVKKDRGKVGYKFQAAYSFGEFAKKMTGKGRKLLGAILQDTDRVVVFTFSDRDDRIGVMVRIREGKARVVGFRD